MKIAAKYTKVGGIAGARPGTMGRLVFDCGGVVIGYISRHYSGLKVGRFASSVARYSFSGVDGTYKTASTLDDLLKKITPLRYRFCTPIDAIAAGALVHAG